MPTLTIIRGLPGSGKTTLARALSAATGAAHFEADMWFERERRAYAPVLLRLAHGWCLDRTFDCLKRGPVVVSNTFTRIYEMAPYILRASEMGADIQVIDVMAPFASTHDVSDEKMEEMSWRWEHTPAQSELVNAASKSITLRPVR